VLVVFARIDEQEKQLSVIKKKRKTIDVKKITENKK